MSSYKPNHSLSFLLEMHSLVLKLDKCICYICEDQICLCVSTITAPPSYHIILFTPQLGFTRPLTPETNARGHRLSCQRLSFAKWVVRLYVEIRVDKHGITILYHLHQCRPCTSRDSSCKSWLRWYKC